MTCHINTTTDSWDQSIHHSHIRLKSQVFARIFTTRMVLNIFYRPKTRVRVVVQGGDVTFAGTESGLKKVRSKMSEWYDIMVRGIVGCGKRDVRQMEILVRNVRLMKELDYEACDRHCQALMAGVALCKASKTVNSAPVKAEEIEREEDEGNGEDKIQELTSDAELHESGQVGRAIRRGREMREDGEPLHEEAGKDRRRHADS